VSFLGNTVELIATNKAGILRRDVPALLGPGCPIQPIQVLFWSLLRDDY
jgi:folylpolyglutamate synthase/dihydropteroate synthase